MPRSGVSAMGEKKARLGKLLPNGRGVWIPLDHGASFYPLSGLEDMTSLYLSLGEGNVDAVVAQKGAVSHFSTLSGPPLVAHLSVSTIHGGERSDDKVVVGSVEEALSRGAIAVSVQVNVGSKHETEMITRMGHVSEQCHRLGVPLLGMMYARGENLQIDGDPTNGVAHAVRLGWELGCDVVKTQWTGSMESFEIVTSGVPIPVLVAGGEKHDDVEGLLKMVKQSILAGGAGVCIGRQVFSHQDPAAYANALHEVVQRGIGPRDAAEKLR